MKKLLNILLLLNSLAVFANEATFTMQVEGNDSPPAGGTGGETKLWSYSIKAIGDKAVGSQDSTNIIQKGSNNKATTVSTTVKGDASVTGNGLVGGNIIIKQEN